MLSFITDSSLKFFDIVSKISFCNFDQLIVPLLFLVFYLIDGVVKEPEPFPILLQLVVNRCQVDLCVVSPLIFYKLILLLQF